MSANTTVVCTLGTCPLSMGVITYQPNIGANAFLIALFALILIVQLALGIRYKTWSFLVAMTFGLVLEAVGYGGRIQLHHDPFNFNYFVQYLVCLTIAPAFFCAAIYITLRRVIHSCDDSLSYFRPKRVSIFFMTMDFICLVLQASGGAITSTAGGTDQTAVDVRNAGVDIMIAGVSLQVVSLVFFITYAIVYTWKWHVAAAVGGRKPTSRHVGLRWKGLVFGGLNPDATVFDIIRLTILGLAIASITILIRSAFRVAELRNGFQSPIASNEVLFMVLEGLMIVLASFFLTLGHPGPCLSIPWRIPKGQ